MPSWKKIVTSGSNATLNSLNVATSLTASIISGSSITGSLFGTSSWAVNALTASFLPVGIYNITSSWAQNALTASFIDSASTNAFVQNGNSFGTTALLGTNDTQNLQFETSDSVRMTISSSGNVGIGTSNPQRRLQVDASGSSNTATPLILTTVDTNNRVGIQFASSSIASGRTHSLIHRTNSPQVEWILGASAGESGTWQFLPRDDSNYTVSVLAPFNGGTARIHTGQSQSLFALGAGSAANHLVISSSGNVGIGTTSPLSLLHILASSGNEFLRVTSGSQNILNVRSGSVVWFAGTGVAPTSNFDFDIQSTGTANGGSVRIAGNGTVYSLSSAGSIARSGTGNNEMFNMTMGGTSTSVIQNPLRIQFDANQNATSGSGYIVLRLNATHASTAGTGSKLLQTWEFAGTQLNVVSSSGAMGIGITTPSASLHISGANTANLFRIQSPASSSIMFVSGSGNVGMGLATPSAQLHISGASNSVLLKIDSPAVNNIIYVSGSGNIGIGTSTPTLATLQIQGNVSASSYTGSLFGTSSWATNALTASFVNTASTNAFVQGGNSFGTTAVLGTNDNQNLQFETSGSVRMTISSSGDVGVGLTNPSAKLYVSGAAADRLLHVGSPSQANILFVTGSGRVGINTSSSLATGLSIFQQSSSFMEPATAPTGSGLYVFSSGSGNIQPSIHVQNIGDGFASINLSTISGSTNPLRMWSLSKRNNANSNALNLYYYNGTTYSSPLFSFVQNGNSTLGESTQITLDDLNGFVGLNVTPNEKVHINAQPGEGNYLRIDADQISNSPPLAIGTAKTGYGIIANSYYLAEPDYWMEIVLGAAGGVVLIPCYLPA